jgi:hypothetical protein
LINEKLGSSIGYLNPVLYSTLDKGGTFHDITEGHNDMTGLVGGYKAAIGWDPCSGLGSPDGGAILAGLQGSKEQQVTRNGGASPAGPQGSKEQQVTPDGGASPAGLQGSKEQQITPDGGASPAGQPEPQKGDELTARRKVSRKKK